jgi:hypothetical protein
LYQQEEVYTLRRFPIYVEAIPAELKPGNMWVCCDEEKVPMIPLVRGWRRASTTNPATWRTLDEALEALGTGRYAGIGRIIKEGESFVGVDIDGCRDPLSGEITPKAWEIVEQLDSYSEVSPSLSGIKIWVRTEKQKIAHIKPGLEIYPKGRYFTVTGQFLSQCPAKVEERGNELEVLIAREFPKPKKRTRAYKGSAEKSLDLDKFLDSKDIEVFAMVADLTAALKYRIVCPWVEEHSCSDTSGTFVGQYPDGALFFHCHHAHCAGRTWQDFRPLFEPKCYEPWWVKVVTKNG